MWWATDAASFSMARRLEGSCANKLRVFEPVQIMRMIEDNSGDCKGETHCSGRVPLKLLPTRVNDASACMACSA